MKKVLHLRSSGGILGAEKVIQEIATKSRHFGYESVVGIIHDLDDPYPEYVDFLRNYKIETVVFDGNGKVDIKRVKSIGKYIDNHKIDLLHSHGYKEDYNCLFVKQNIPKIATNHLWKRTNIKSRIYTFTDALFLQFFNIVTGVSSEIMGDMNKYYLRRTVKIPNGIDTAYYCPIEKSIDLYKELDIPKGSVILGMISSITKVKGHEIAVRAYKRIRKNKQVYLLIVGEGEMSDRIKNLADREGIKENVRFAGKTERVRDYLSIIDIFLITSFREGLPMALLEAMAVEKAVIATKVGEIINVITDNVNGLLIYPNDIEQLANKVDYLIVNKKIRLNMGIEARRTVVKKYSSTRMVRNYCRLYDVITR